MTRARRTRVTLLFSLAAIALLINTSQHSGSVPDVDLVAGNSGGTMAGARVALAQASTYLQTFDGTPSAPQDWHPSDWDVQVHHVDEPDWKVFPPIAAQHSSACGAPPATHMVTTHEQAVFLCNGHVMTTIYAGYGVIYLTPNQLVDFSAGEAVVRFDVSTFRTSTRDWIDLWITPFEDNLALPLDDIVDLNGPPKRSVHINMVDGITGAHFLADVFRNFTADSVPTETELGYEQVLTPSAVNREPFELRISRTHLKFGLPNRNLWWIDRNISDLGWTQGVVQLGHHTYNVEKGCPEQTTPCPNTWHWDNVQIAPAVPFTILRANRRYVDATSTSTVTFPAPAPSGAYLRFGGVGTALQVSVNGGASWQNAQAQAQQLTHGANAFSSYWTPIPAGTTQVQFRGQNSALDWMVRDISIFAGGPQPSIPPTSTSTPTSTPVQSTPTRTPTSAPGTPTATPVPVSCSPRPPVTTTVTKESTGVLRVTVAASSSISRINFDPRGAIVRRPGQPDQAAPFAMTPGATSSTFRVVQQTPGTSATVFLVVTDGCGPFQTFVGGGPGAF